MHDLRGIGPATRRILWVSHDLYHSAIRAGDDFAVKKKNCVVSRSIILKWKQGADKCLILLGEIKIRYRYYAL